VTEDPLDQLAPRVAKGLAIGVCIVVGGAVYFVAGFMSIWDGACEGMSCATRTSSVLMALGVALIATLIAVVVHRAHPKWTWVVALLACAEAAWSIASTHGSTLVASARGTGGPAVVIDAERVTVGSAKLGAPPGRLRSVLGPGRRGSTWAPSRDWTSLGVPGTYRFPGACGPPRFKPVIEISYAGAQVTSCRGRSFLIVITGRGSHTTQGAAIGQPLTEAARRHPGLTCSTSTGDTTEPAVPEYRYCTGRIGRGRYL
jgi:hypothetical protein